MTIQSAGQQLLNTVKKAVASPQNRQLVQELSQGVSEALRHRFPQTAQEIQKTFGKGTTARNTVKQALQNTKAALNNAQSMQDVGRSLKNAFTKGGDGEAVLKLFQKTYSDTPVGLNKAGTIQKAANQFSVLDIVRTRANQARRYLDTHSGDWRGAMNAFLQPARDQTLATRGEVRQLLHKAKTHVIQRTPQAFDHVVQGSKDLWAELWKP